MKNKIFNYSFIMALLLSFAGGYVELYSVKVHGVFACMQTGNMINMFSNFADDKISLGLENLFVAVVFFIGCVLSEFLVLKFEKKTKYFESFILISMIFFAIIPIFIPLNIENATHNMPNIYDVLSNASLAILGAFQYCVFKKVNNIGYASTMMTATLRNISVNLVDGISKKDKIYLVNSLEYFLFLICFLLGSVTFYLLFKFVKVDNQDLFYQLLPLGLIFVLLIALIISLVNAKKKTMS